MYEEYKFRPMQIFEMLQPQYLQNLMANRKGQNFIMDKVDLLGNFGDANSTRFFFNLITGKVNVKVSEPVLTTLLTFANYFEDHQIVRRLKQYRPQRRPITQSILAGRYHGVDKKDMPEHVKRKRKLLVRDWFYYVLWYVRLRNVERKKATAWDRLCKA